MTKQLSRGMAVLVSCLTMACAVGGEREKSDERVNPDALLLRDFEKRVDAYMDVHKRLRKESPPLKETNDPAKIQTSQDVLAGKIQAARKDAKPGEVFTPEIRQLFRRLMYPELKGADGAETKETIKEDAPKAISLKVNARYPEAAPLPTVPANLLAALPKLPEELEYRIVNRDLLLRDVHANVIVDFVPNAIR